MAARELTLKYPATCRRCGAQLAVGVRAQWSSETKATTCIRCETPSRTPKRSTQRDPASRSPQTFTTPGAANNPAPSGPDLTSPWQRLFEYHRRAVTRASVTEPASVSRRASWRILDLPSEGLVTGVVEDLAATGPIKELFADLPVGEAVYYGWPVVITTDRTGAQQIAPVVMTELEQPEPDAERVVAHDDQPYLKPGLFNETYFPAEALASIDASLAIPLPFGEPDALRARVAEILTGVGIEASEVDPHWLARHPELRPGAHNLAMVFKGPSDGATRALILELAELRDRTDWHETAAAVLVEHQPRAGFTTTDTAPPQDLPVSFVTGLPPLSVRSLRLNDSQEQALTSTAEARVTVVTGPPGTGKSQLVAGIVANQWLAGRTVLVASTNNTAVKVAVDRCASIDPTLLVRTGNQEHREALPDTVKKLEVGPASPGLSRDIIRRQLEAAAASRTLVFETFATRAATESELAQALRDVEGLRTILWGGPQTEPSRAERRQLHTLARKRADSRWFTAGRGRKILALAHPQSPATTLDDVLHWAALDARVDNLTTHLTALGPADPDADRAALADADQAWSEAGHRALADTVQTSISAGGNALHHLATTRRQYRAARTKAIAQSLPFLRGWACTTLPARENFPLVAGLFDLLVIDEASQCSLAQILPLAYRARRIVVVGDPNQLTPIVNLNRAHLDTIATACGTTEAAVRQLNLSAGADSAYTAFAARSGTSPYLLDEHYRCHPQIASFINEHFYGGALRVLTDVSGFDQDPRGLSFVDIDGTCERGQTSGVLNRDEADAITAWMLAHHTPRSGTLGIVTPFAAQVDLLRQRVRSAVGAETASRITIGTAHAFQGGECDVVLFSLVLAADAPLGTAKWVESQRNLVNVAVSRAKRALVVFGNGDALTDLPVPTLHALVSAAREAVDPQGAPPTATDADLAEVADLHSDAEKRLYASLLRLGVPVRLKPIIEGYELDFSVQTPTGLVDIEVDGNHHIDQRGRQRRQDLARDAVLNRLAIRVIRVPAWRCLQDPDKTARNVAAQLA